MMKAHLLIGHEILSFLATRRSLLLPLLVFMLELHKVNVRKGLGLTMKLEIEIGLLLPWSRSQKLRFNR